MNEKKPTLSAQRRFESISEMLPVKLFLGEGSVEDRGDAPIKGTLVDVSAGAMSVRIPLDDDKAESLRETEEGSYLEIEVEQSANHRWTVLGYIAWLWVPAMKGDDTIGSAGINIAGVIEEDDRLIGKLRRALGQGKPVEIEKKAKIIESPAKRRERERTRQVDDSAEAMKSNSEETGENS
jgi:hypothetical protein